MFLQDWQAACPNAVTWAVPGLKDRGQVRRSGVRIDAELTDSPPRVWAEEIDQVLVTGPVFKEVCLFHRPSKTLLLTDLVINLEGDLLPAGSRTLARMLGIVAPDGKAPLYLRLLLRMNNHEVTQAARRLVAFNPDRVIFTHGLWFYRDAAGQLRHSLSWLLGSAGDERRLPRSSGSRVGPPRTSTVLIGAALLSVVALAAYARKSRR